MEKKNELRGVIVIASVSWHVVDFHSHQVALPLACLMREAPEFFELILGSRRQYPDTEPPSRVRGINWMSLHRGGRKWKNKNPCHVKMLY